MGKQKFYAVRVGRQPGVYYTWDDCKKQVDGYGRAEYKSFGTLAEAQAFVGAANAPLANAPANATKRGSAGGSGTFYAIAAGRETGIFSCKWDDIQHLVHRYPNARYERFTTLQAAEEYMAEFMPSDTDQHASGLNDAASKRRKNSLYSNPAPPPAFMPQQSVQQPQPSSALPKQTPTQAASTSVNTSQHESVVMYFDGGSRKNPGRAGYGFVIYDSSLQHKLRMGCRPLKYGSSNNQAEYTGMLEGIRYSTEQLHAKNLVIRGDSDLVIKQMKGVYRVLSDLLTPLHDEAKQLLKGCSSVTFEHVYREQNKEADELSNLAMDTDQAVDDVLQLWRRGIRDRASYVDVLVKLADVEADSIAVQHLQQSPSFLQASATLLAMLWDLPQHQVKDMLQERGWTDVIGGPPVLVQQPTARIATSAAGLQDSAAAAVAESGRSHSNRSGRGLHTVAVAAVTLGGDWGQEIRRQEAIMQQQQQQASVEVSTEQVGKGSSLGGDLGACSRSQQQQRCYLPQCRSRSGYVSIAAPAAGICLSGQHAAGSRRLLYCVPGRQSDVTRASLPTGSSEICHHKLRLLHRKQRSVQAASTQQWQCDLHTRSVTSSRRDVQCLRVRSSSRCRLAGVVASTALVALNHAVLGRRSAGRGVQGFGGGGRPRSTSMRLPAA